MLSRQRRLTTEVFDQVIASGRIFHSPTLTLTAMKAEGKSRFAAVAPKKYFKTAVERNKIRRRLYAVIDDAFLARIDANLNNVGFHCIIVAKLAIMKLKKPELAAALNEIFVKSQILK